MMEKPRQSLVRIIEITMPTHLGFHLRVVARFVRCVRQFHSVIRVRKGKVTADGKNIHRERSYRQLELFRQC